MKKNGKKAILCRLDGLEQRIAVLDGRLDAERKTRLDQFSAAFKAWEKQKDRLDELLRKTDELDERQRADASEFRALLEDLENWMLAAKKGCSALRSIPFPVAGAVIDPHAVKAAGVGK